MAYLIDNEIHGLLSREKSRIYSIIKKDEKVEGNTYTVFRNKHFKRMAIVDMWIKMEVVKTMNLGILL